MARPLRISFPGAIYHVTGRMLGSWRDDRDALFRDNRDRERFLERLGQSVEDHEGRLYLYCLMSNHYHLLLETPRGNVSRLMQSVTTGYTVYFNRRHQRHGHLFDGRFKSELVSGDEYLLKLQERRFLALALAYLRFPDHQSLFDGVPQPLGENLQVIHSLFHRLS